MTRQLLSAGANRQPLNCRTPSLPGKGRQVYVSTGEYYAELWSAAVRALRQIQRRHHSWPQQRGNGHRARWLNDDFHSLPDEPRGENDLLLADQEDTFDMAAQDREGPWGERGAQAVRNGVARVL